MLIEVTTKIKFKGWNAPNFALLEITGKTDGHAIPIADLDEDALAALAMGWLENLYSGTNLPFPFTPKVSGAKT